MEAWGAEHAAVSICGFSLRLSVVVWDEFLQQLPSQPTIAGVMYQDRLASQVGRGTGPNLWVAAHTDAELEVTERI